ncbi:MAG: MFS transporter [Chloroflexi bacterium]|jgi:DHA1 family tetracycline resistance protein-like MFS transporter|nr:MFS transporter [Chloroflexota bacterium]
MLKRFSTIDRRLITILLIIFVQMVGAAMIVPILPLYARSEFGLSDQLNTMLITIFFLGQFVGGPYLGRLSDRIGRIPVLIVSQLGTALCFVLLAVAGTPWLLFVARLVDGITGGNIIVAQAYITDITPSERRTEALGYTFAVFGIGFIIGPAVGGLLAAELGPRVPYLIAAAAAFAVAIMTWLILEETVPRNGPAPQGVVQRPQEPQRRLALGDVFTNQMLFLVLIIALAGQFAFGMLQATFALYGNEVLFTGQPDDVVTSNVAYLLTVVGVGQFATQAFLLRPARNRLGETWLVIVGLLARTAGLAILAASRSFWPGALASLFFATGSGLMMPPLQTLATWAVDDRDRGAALGLYQGSVSLATIISTGIAGFIFAWQPTAPYWFGAALSLVVVLPSLMLVREWRNGQAVRKQQAAGSEL